MLCSKLFKPRVVLFAGTILTAVTLLGGATVLCCHAEEQMNKNLQVPLERRVHLTEIEIGMVLDGTVPITPPLLIDLLPLVNVGADSTSVRNILNMVVQSFILKGFTAAVAAFGAQAADA
jgi:hypothetical protein